MNQILLNILTEIGECNKMLEEGIVEDAVLLSGEALAKAYELWSNRFNDNSPTAEEINVMAIAASCHCSALASMGNFHDAYATAIGAILQISVDPNHSNNISQSLLSIYTTASLSLINQLSTSIPDDDDSRNHAETISRYLASMLYYYYNLVGQQAPNSPYLDSAYETLCIMRQLTEIETPVISVLNKEIDPSTPHALIGDLVGRSQALYLLTD